MVEVKIIADSICNGKRITTMQLKYIRFVHAEFMTHRVFSRNASSSRAIPVWKIIKQVLFDPALPVHYGSNKSGMQAGAELTGLRLKVVKGINVLERLVACAAAWVKIKMGLHKQVANRYLEPWQYISVVVTATDWDNYFNLRCHPAAQPEIQELAYKMQEALAASVPKQLETWQWHLPYVTEKDMEAQRVSPSDPGVVIKVTDYWNHLIKLSVARCARVSYLNHDQSKPDPTKDYDLHDKLVAGVPIHASPAEHQAQPMSGRWANFNGWRQYRGMVEDSLKGNND